MTQATAAQTAAGRRTLMARLSKELRRHGRLHIMLLLPLAYLIIFSYVPMANLVIAFQDYSVRRGVLGSEWVGLKHFEKIFSTPIFGQLLRNTLALSVYSFLAGFPMPILLALALNETRNKAFMKTIQSITYAPYFLSTVVVVSIMIQFFHTRTGLVNNVIQALGGTPRNFMGEAESFRHLYVWSGVWKSTGYSAVLFMASLASVDPSLHEAAILDGANRVQRVWHVDLPTILPTIVISMILSLGSLMSLGYEKAYLMQNDLNSAVSEILSTYVYKRGLQDIQYSYSTALGLFNSVCNLVLICMANFIARHVGETSLW